MPKAIIAITSYSEVFYDDGKKTVDFTSETGSFGIDEHSTGPDFLNGEDLKAYEDKNSDYSIAISKIKKAKDVNPDEFSIFFASAGHGTLFDYPTGGVVAAVCHGPAIFENLNDLTTGKPIIEGKTITGFTDIGEEILKVDGIMKDKNLRTIKETAAKFGATYSEPNGPWDDYTYTDGKIVTGVNPQSAESTAVKAIEVLQG
ncbi:class I glutamine amidotransferase-like protein [Scheffersomyces xylosifermentans]|uniref:class I glutamine amidotransferase-like protein n=1 Tax=Scheffersomyces xylosifermentans TaxID=1304137 RepID=UPI00315D3B68